MRLALAALALVAGTAAAAREPQGMHAALEQLTREGRFSGAVVVRDADGVRFARGYGMADPFTGRRFTPQTPVDSGSLAKPVTHAVVLQLVRQGRINLDAPVRDYLAAYPHTSTTVRHLLSHSAGLPLPQSEETLAGKTNADLLGEARDQARGPAFPPGTRFTYCNMCTITLALLVERVTGRHLLFAARDLARLPRPVTIRPARLADWNGRAIGYRQAAVGKLERFDSWEGEAFYGPANLSISAAQLASWGSEWWKPSLRPILVQAATPAQIGGHASGLSLGNWYCAPVGRRCHYLGHHEGFHHMLYWDADRRISVAMVSNNAMAPELHQRLQRALVALAEGRTAAGRSELAASVPVRPPAAGTYEFPDGQRMVAQPEGDNSLTVERGAVRYPAYPVSRLVRYVPGLDVYIGGAADGRLHWLGLYEDLMLGPVPGQAR